MRIIISPAKKMDAEEVALPWEGLPQLLSRTEVLLGRLQQLSYEECKVLWACSDSLAELNYDRLRHMDLQRNLSPALLTYVGIQYQYMAASVLDDGSYAYLQDKLRILSGFYGALRPFDGVTPYRLEMQAKLQLDGCADLYDFWGSSIYDAVVGDETERKPDDSSGHTIINLASKEYSRCIQSFLQPDDQFIDVVFGEMKNGRVVQKGTLAKMARGEMVRYLASVNAQSPDAMRDFNALEFSFDPSRSTEVKYVFLR